MSTVRQRPARRVRTLHHAKRVLFVLSLLPPSLLVASLLTSTGDTGQAPKEHQKEETLPAVVVDSGSQPAVIGKQDQPAAVEDAGSENALPRSLDPKKESKLKPPGTVRNLHRVDRRTLAP